jgi:hypothetical protein
VGVEDSPILEIDELMLPAPPHTGDAGTDECPALPWRKAAPERRMVDLDRLNRATDDVLAELNDGALDLRQFRHAR